MLQIVNKKSLCSKSGSLSFKKMQYPFESLRIMNAYVQFVRWI